MSSRYRPWSRAQVSLAPVGTTTCSTLAYTYGSVQGLTAQWHITYSLNGPRPATATILSVPRSSVLSSELEAPLDRGQVTDHATYQSPRGSVKRTPIQPEKKLRHIHPLTYIIKVNTATRKIQEYRNTMKTDTSLFSGG